MSHGGDPTRATLDEFIEICRTKYGFELLTLEMRGPRGDEVAEYLVRRNGHVLECVLPRLPRNVPLPSEQLASMCNRLGLSCAEFGLFIG